MDYEENRKRIIDAYKQAGTIRRAAKIAGVSPSRVHQVVQKYAPELMYPPHIITSARRDVHEEREQGRAG